MSSPRSAGIANNLLAPAIALLMVLATGWAAIASIPSPVALAEWESNFSDSTAEHRIGVRVVEGNGEFYDRQTGERFVPRGANLIRLSGGSHSTLDPGAFDPARIDATFAQMASAGFNTVRIFLNSYPGGLPGVSGSLSQDYLDNVADVLRLAKNYGLYVILTADWLPESPDWAVPPAPLIENVNLHYLSEGGHIVNERFWRAFAMGLIERRAPLDALLAYELRNELYFTTLFPPFSLNDGAVRTANGRTYSLSNPADKRQMLEDNLMLWVDRMRAAILAVDPSALVTVGFFQPQGPNTSRVGDDRLIETSAVIRQSTADFIDLHAYPGGDLTLLEIVENFDLPPVTEKPILLGEFGADHAGRPTIDDAIRDLVDWQIASCSFGFDGWLLWTWDTVEQPEFWNALDEEGSLAAALSPVQRPDPCSIGSLDLAVDLARIASATSSSELADAPADQAIDGLIDTVWNSGGSAPQWIQIDLRTPSRVVEIRLLVAQDPSGPSQHVILIRFEGGWQQLHVFSESTRDGQWLVFRPDAPLQDVLQVRVETTASVSWVAWREISILGRQATDQGVGSVLVA